MLVPQTTRANGISPSIFNRLNLIMLMKIPQSLRFTKEHEWIAEVGPQRVRVGISDYAQHELGDVVFVDLPELGASVEAGLSMLSVESVKAVSDVYSPVTGKVVEVNPKLSGEPELVNSEPYDAGWMVVIEVRDEGIPSDLMSAAAYEEYLSELVK